MQLRARTFKIFLSIRHVCYTCCVLHESCKSDAVEDFSTTEPPKCLLIGRVRPKGRGEAASALGQPAASGSALSHPFPRPGSKWAWPLSSAVFGFVIAMPCRLGEAGADAQLSEGSGWESRSQAGHGLAVPSHLTKFLSWDHPGITLVWALRPAQPHLAPLRDPLAHYPCRRWIKQLYCLLFYLQEKKKKK